MLNVERAEICSGDTKEKVRRRNETEERKISWRWMSKKFGLVSRIMWEYRAGFGEDKWMGGEDWWMRKRKNVEACFWISSENHVFFVGRQQLRYLFAATGLEPSLSTQSEESKLALLPLSTFAVASPYDFAQRIPFVQETYKAINLTFQACHLIQQDSWNWRQADSLVFWLACQSVFQSPG